jgi:hypothetical protein
MMRRTCLICDRCHKVVEGRYNEDTEETEGYYFVKSGEFADLNEGNERNVCDNCIDGKTKKTRSNV